MCRLGQVPYRPTWELQRTLAQARKRQLIPDTLLILEHNPVVTFGRNVGPGSLILSDAQLSERGIELVEVDRGGDATYHGPGQLVAYPILDLSVDCRDVRRYVWRLEQSMIEVMRAYGVIGDRLEGAPGAWVRATSPRELDRKMGAVGVRLSRWVTHHGVGFNVNTRLEDFQVIVPCGLSDKGVTSLSREFTSKGQGSDAPSPLDFQEVAGHFVRCFARLFQRRVVDVSLEALHAQLEGLSRDM